MKANFYKGYTQWKNWDSSSFANFTRLDAIYFSQELKCSGVIVRNNIRILEIGFGNGVFAGWAKANRLDYIGVEKNPELVKRALEHGVSAIVAPDDLRILNEQFDVAIGFDVIEHLSLNEVISLFEQIRSVLKPGGLFIARVPSGDSPFSGAIYHGDITHCTLLGSGAIRQLSENTGYELLQIRSPVLPVIGVGMLRSLRRIALIATRKIVRKFISIVFQDNKDVVITNNMVFVLKRKGLS